MICDLCKKEINNQLVLFSGSLACPECKRKITDRADSLTITKESDEVFLASESAFYRGLRLGDTKLLDRAIELCNEACNMNHFKAFMRMGYYYDKGIAGYDLSKKYRYLLAYEYYSIVCYSNISSADLEVDYDVLKIKKEAANLLIAMLSDFKEGALINDKFKLEKTANILRSKGLIGSSFVSKENKAIDFFDEDVNDLLSNHSNALFAIYRLKASKLYEHKRLDDNSEFFKLCLSRKVVAKYVIEGGTVDKAITTVNQFQDYREDLDDVLKRNKDANILIMIFNNNCNFHFIGKNGKTKIKKELFDDVDLLLHIIELNKTKNVFVFYEDDVFYTLKGKSLTNLKENFENYIQEESING